MNTEIFGDGAPPLKPVTSKPPKTLGEFRVRTDFNVSGSGYVDEIKQAAAQLMDSIDRAAAKPDWDQRYAGEFNRLKALALTNIEQGAMWAVKMATL